ncbi:hypothetical protein AAG570_002020 [Ranatra chinensis]|uniref:Uncharacterized protein n=1 Tax=Ranatra chinensis TaxID=642074 RepID=A0ABD0YA82_9HEMI
MENLGLGNLRFEHTVMVHRRPGGQFEEVHHSLNLHSHNHTSANTTGTTRSEECLSPERMLSAYGLGADHDVAISPAGFHHICPAIVYQLDEKVCTRPTALPHPSHLNNVTLVVWLYASLSILVISVCGLIGVSVVPLLADRPLFGSLLTALSALALGTLTGDALLHLLPHVSYHLLTYNLY